MDGTAASRSIAAAKGRASRDGTYSVRNSATPIDTGTEMTIATTDEITVTQSRSATPNCGGAPPGFQTLEVRKPAWLSRSDGRACASRNSATAAITTTTKMPDPSERPAKI